MGVENSTFKNKSKNNSRVIKPLKKITNQMTVEQNNYLKRPSISDDLNGEADKIVSRPHSKSIKVLKSNKKPQVETINKPKNENLKDLKSFSVQNLEKIENNHNLEGASRDSVETNCYTNKSKEDLNKMLNEELYDDIDDINSFEEEDDKLCESEEIEENENGENEEEKKQKELTITNNIKAVFIDSKSNSNSREQLEILNENSNRKSLTMYDYELNFYRNGNDIRQSYLTKLISTQIWTPNMKPKQHNSIIIFDWDDTLLPTSFLTPCGVFNEEMSLPEMEAEKLLSIEQCVLKLLIEAVEKGNVYIITNAGKGWVEYSAKRFFPSIIHILEKIKIISARGQYEKIFPGNSRQWKIEAFLNLQKNLNMKLVTNIVCIGDSLFEMEAGRILASRFTEAFIKTIKFREAPKLDELIQQLKLVSSQFGSIYSSIKNLTIRVEKKKKEE